MNDTTSIDFLARSGDAYSAEADTQSPASARCEQSPHSHPPAPVSAETTSLAQTAEGMPCEGMTCEGMLCESMPTEATSAECIAPTDAHSENEPSDNEESQAQTSNCTRSPDRDGPSKGCIVLNADALRKLRNARLMSQQELADNCYRRNIQISIATIKRAEMGHRVRFRIARELARCFDVPVMLILRVTLDTCGDTRSDAESMP